MKRKTKIIIRKLVIIISSITLAGCVLFLIYYLGIQPYHSRQVNNKYKEIYYSSDSNPPSQVNNVSEDDSSFSVGLDTSYESGAKGTDGILLKFSKLLEINSDIKGWLKVPGTNIDYPVMQAYNGSDFYLKHDFEGSKDKNGCLYIQGTSSIKPRSKNIVIHGHNMDSTGMMFHQLLKYKDVDFYKKNPTITFDSLYNENEWKIIGYIRVSGDLNSSGNFNYMQSDFETTQDFLNFLYEIKLRSSYNCPVDVNEKDSLLMLSTCSYEISNYRTVLVCRRVRKNESSKVDTSEADYNKDVLYPSSWYGKYGGAKPKVTSFENAMSFGEIDWYDGKLEVESSIDKILEVEDASYKILSSSEVEFVGFKNSKLKEFTIPSTIEYDNRTFDVISISKDAFQGMKKLVSLKIGNNIQEIPKRCFMECKNLENVIIGDNVKTIHKKAFYKLEKLKTIKIRSLVLETIDEKAFGKISSKAKFKLPKEFYKTYKTLINKSTVNNTFKYVKFSDKQ